MRDRLSYWFDRLMSRGTIALIGGLFVLAIAMIVFIALVLVLTGIGPEDGREPLSFVEAVWNTSRRTLDPGVGAEDMGWRYRLVGLVSTLVGILFVSTLIGTLASGLQNRFGDLRRGRSRVMESGHIVILGWSPQIFSIVTELAFANKHMARRRGVATGKRSACIAILAVKDRLEMADEIRAKAPNTTGTRIVCRSGDPTDPNDLRLVRPETARSIIVLSPGGSHPDLPVVMAIVALTKDRQERSHRYHIVAALHSPTSLQLARMIGGDEIQVFAVDGLVSRLIAQTCRHPGLSIVYTELFSFEGAAIFFVPAGNLAGYTYGDALFRFPNAALIGLQDQAGQVWVNPPMGTLIQAGDTVIVIAFSPHVARTLPASAPHSIDLAAFGVDLSAICQETNLSPPPEDVLILGWNHRGPMIIEQLSYYLPPASNVRVVVPMDSQRFQTECAAIDAQHTQMTFEYGNPMERATLERLVAGGVQYVVILSPEGASDVKIADASTIVSLLHLRDISRQTGKSFPIVSEILDIRNWELAEVTSADDHIVSERLVAENKAAVSVFVDFLNAEGSEIYLKPAEEYVCLDRPVNFYTVVESARRKAQSAIGYRLLAESSAPEWAFGVHINPEKSTMVTFSREDRIIVVAES